VFLSRGEKIFTRVNSFFLSLMAIICLLPIWNVLCVSFSSSGPAAAGRVKLWPVGLTLSAYNYVLERPEYMTAFGVTIQRTLLGVAISLVICILTAYPLSKESEQFPQRTPIVWFFFFTMLFSGGLIPTFATITALGLIDSIWVLVIPNALNVWNVVMLLNFMRRLPKEVTESAYVDGAGEWMILIRIILPMSLPIIATLTLFIAVGHWNSWFDALIYMNKPKNYPLQTYLQSLVVRIDTERMKSMSETELQAYANISNRTFNAAQIFIATIPILCAYPFLQKYFVQGIVVGSVKE